MVCRSIAIVDQEVPFGRGMAFHVALMNIVHGGTVLDPPNVLVEFGFGEVVAVGGNQVLDQNQYPFERLGQAVQLAEEPRKQCCPKKRRACRLPDRTNLFREDVQKVLGWSYFLELVDLPHLVVKDRHSTGVPAACCRQKLGFALAQRPVLAASTLLDSMEQMAHHIRRIHRHRPSRHHRTSTTLLQPIALSLPD